MFFRLIMLIVPLLKEIFLYEEEEDVMDPRSKKFDLRKALPILITVACIASLFFSVDRLIRLTMRHIELKNQHQILGEQYEALHKEHETLGHDYLLLRSEYEGCYKNVP